MAMHHRRFDFDEAALVEETPHRLHDLGALGEDLAHLGIHGEIDVAAAIARLHVLQAVPLLGQGKQVLHQESDFLDVDREFVRAGAEEISLHPDVVAQVEQLVKLESLLADGVEPDIDLKPLPGLLQMREARLALHANGHESSSDADVDARRFQLRARLGRELLDHLRDGVGGFVAIGISGLPKRLNLLQLFFA